MVNGLIFKNAVISGANNITNYKKEINDLNIFPVPDGDTGTNMSMTITAAKSALEQMDTPSAAQAAKAVASAMLRGARGNSGVILSLIFKGFAQAFEGKDEITGKDIANALKLGTDAAYKAVMKPTEGTMLTVVRLASEAAQASAVINNDPAAVFKTAYKASLEALELTPQLLPVLKKAGVVDAGGRGLCEIFCGMLSVICYNEMVEAKSLKGDNEEETDAFRSAAAEFDEVINFTYCTEFIVENEKQADPTELRAYLETIGDCVVVVSDDEIIKVHVHTENPGNALQRGLQYGQLLTVKVENMREQHKNAAEKSKAQKQAAPEKLEFAAAEQDFGFVAVAAGEGLVSLFKDLGCNHVVSGGQTMNPSTEDIHKAILATPAKNVFVLPNNKNIIMAAQQAAPLIEDRRVIILPTKTIPQGLAAMLSFDEGASIDENEQAMLEGAKRTSTGQVTFAARNSEFGSNKIKEGDIIALENGKLTITDKDPTKALIKLVKSMVKKNTEYITVIYGENITDEQADRAVAAISAKVSDKIDITLVSGGQPVYYFIVSVE